MDTAEKVYSLLKERHGYLTMKEALENGINNKTMQRMADRGLIERVAHGLYVGADVFPDPFYVAQYRCPKGVFSNETALFLHDFCDRAPLKLMITIPSGWNTKLLTDNEISFFYSSAKKMGLGVSEIETLSGMIVKVYNIERTLCDCLKNIDRLDRDLVLTALKRYIRGKNRDSAKLLDYATALKIRDTVYKYLEVLV